MSANQIKIDENQGTDASEQFFGYCGIEGQGGYFFNYHPTLRETLDSISADEIDPPTWDAPRLISRVRSLVRKAWNANPGLHRKAESFAR